MSKKRKRQYYFIIASIVILVLLMLYVIGSMVFDVIGKTKTSNKIVSEFNELYESDEVEIVLFASPTCKWCKQFVPILDELSKENDFKYYYFDMTEVFDNEFDKIEEKLDLEIKSIPKLVVIKDKQVIGEQTGAESKENTYEFLAKLNIVGGIEDVEEN